MIVDLEERVEIIEERNLRVEADKAWETSFLRRGMIAGITYASGIVLLTLVGHVDAWKHALVPVMGYLISTFSLPPLKKIWIDQKLEHMKEKMKEGAKRRG